MGNTGAATNATGEMSNKEKREIIKQWFADNYSQLTTNVWKVCGKRDDIVYKWGDDLLPWFIEGFLKRDIKDQWRIFTDDKFENYCTRGMALALKSSTSPFYNEYRKKAMSLRELHYGYDYGLYDEEHKKEINIELIREAIKELNYYDRYIISKYYIEGATLKEMYLQTKINAATLSNDIKVALEKLKIILLDKDISL